MSYPKWRHHPTKESMIVVDQGVEDSQCHEKDGWRDWHKDFDKPVEAPKKRGRWPKKDAE